MLMNCSTCTRSMCIDHFPAINRIKAQRKKGATAVLEGVTFRCPCCWFEKQKQDQVVLPYIVSKLSTSPTDPSALTCHAGIHKGRRPRFS